MFIEWVKIQYLSWMLTNIHCVPDEKDSSKRKIPFVTIVQRKKNSIQFEPTSCRIIKVCKTEIIKKISTYATKKDIYTPLSENVQVKNNVFY